MPLPVEEGAEDYEAFLHFDARHQGGPGLVHGGIVAAASTKPPACSPPGSGSPP